MRDVFWPLAGTLLMQTVTSLIFLAVPVLAPVIAAEGGFEASRIGLYSALVFIAAMPVSLLIGGLIGRFGALRVMQVGMFASAFGLLGALPGTLFAVLASGVVVGLGYGPNTPGASHILARFTTQQQRPLVFSIKQSGAPLGGFLAGITLPWLAITFGWREALMFAALCGVLGLLLVQPLRQVCDDDRRPDAPISFIASLRQLRFLASSADMKRLTFASFIYAAIQMCVFSFLVVYLVAEAGLDLIAAGLAFSLMQLAGVVARIGWGWVAERLVPSRFVLAGLGAGSALLVAVIVQFDASWPFWALALVSIAAGATAAGWNGVFLAEVVRVAPAEQVSAAIGGTIFFTYFGLVVGPAVLSGVVAVAGYDAAFYLIAAAIAVAAWTVLSMGRAQPRR